MAKTMSSTIQPRCGCSSKMGSPLNRKTFKKIKVSCPLSQKITSRTGAFRPGLQPRPLGVGFVGLREASPLGEVFDPNGESRVSLKAHSNYMYDE